MRWCKCLDIRPLRLAIADLVDECGEFMHEPSMDELSDIVWACGRILGSMSGRVVVRLPGDGRHYRKIRARMEKYGCVRSTRHKCAGGEI